MTPEQLIFFIAGIIKDKDTLDEKDTSSIRDAIDVVCHRIVNGQTPKMQLPGLQAYRDIQPPIMGK